MDTYCSNDVTELAKALIEVQKDMLPATKDANNPFTKSNYATLNSVMDSCRQALLAHGIWLTQLPVPSPFENGHIALLTKLTHAESGQWQSSMIVAPLPKNDPQGYGSALTYCRRYALTAMLGMVTEDDDAEAAKIKTDGSPAKPQSNTPKNHNQRQMGVSDSYSEFDGLPKLDGVQYEMVSTEDGRNCVIAKGKTLPKKSILAGAGFRWDPAGKCWWKYLDAA